LSKSQALWENFGGTASVSFSNSMPSNQKEKFETKIVLENRQLTFTLEIKLSPWIINFNELRDLFNEFRCTFYRILRFFFSARRKRLINETMSLFSHIVVHLQ
jgi:hypothetical protein